MENKDKLFLELNKSLEFRNYEIDNFWKRGWFFGVLIIFLLTTYFSLIKNGLLSYTIFLSFLQFLVALLQTLMNRGSKYWQERWEFKVKNREMECKIDITRTEKYNENEHKYIYACILSKNENILTRAHHISVSKLAFLVWDILVIFCFYIWLNDLLYLFTDAIPLWVKILVYHVSLLLYIILFFWKGEATEKWNRKRLSKETIKIMVDRYLKGKE